MFYLLAGSDGPSSPVITSYNMDMMGRHLVINFTAPSLTGSSAIWDYEAACDPIQTWYNHSDQGINQYNQYQFRDVLSEPVPCHARWDIHESSSLFIQLLLPGIYYKITIAAMNRDGIIGNHSLPIFFNFTGICAAR